MAHERYATRHQLPPVVREHLCAMRALEDAGGDRTASSAYLRALHGAGWSLRELANGFGGVTAKTIADRLERAARGQATTTAPPPSLVVSLDSLRQATATAWSTWCQVTSRPADHQKPVAAFVEEFDFLDDAGYDTERLCELVVAGAHLVPVAGDHDDVARAVWAFAYVEGEAAAAAAAQAGPAHPFPDSARALSLAVPAPGDHPTPPAQRPGAQDAYVMDPDVAATIASLAVRARQVRGSTSPSHPNRIASQKLSVLMAAQREAGATYTVLGAAAGMTYTAVKFRLARYGFAAPAPSQAASFVADLAAATLPTGPRERRHR